MDDEVPADQMVTVGYSNICLECFHRGIKPNFIDALRSEIYHPVKYEGQILNIDNFEAFFTPEFLAAYRIKIQEYAVSIPDRLYCDNINTATREICGHFIGSKGGRTAASYPCSSCSTPEMPVHICAKCLHSFSGSSPDQRSCGALEDPLKDLTCGIDYQICPNTNCNTKVELGAACNHMTCGMCFQHFCYICGDYLQLGHFSLGNPCPKYGKKGSPTAMFDAPLPAGAVHGPIPGVHFPPWEEHFGIGPFVIEAPVAPVPLGDMARLAEDHRRLLDTINFDHWRGGFDARIRAMQLGLVHEIAHAYALPQDGARWQDVGANRLTHAAIVAVARPFTRAVLRREQGLRVVYRTYLNAWNDRRDDRGRVIVGT